MRRQIRLNDYGGSNDVLVAAVMCRAGRTPHAMLRTIKRACTAVCVLHVCASVVPFVLSDIDGAAARALRSVPLVLYVVQWATVVFVVRLVCLFKARLGPYAKPLTVWTVVACVCGVVQIPLMAVGFDVEGGENIEIVSLAVNAIFMCYFFYVLCRIVPKVKALLDSVPEEDLAAERYYILSPGPAGGTVTPDDSSPADVEMAMTPTTAAAATT